MLNAHVLEALSRRGEAGVPACGLPAEDVTVVIMLYHKMGTVWWQHGLRVTDFVSPLSIFTVDSGKGMEVRPSSGTCDFCAVDAHAPYQHFPCQSRMMDDVTAVLASVGSPCFRAFCASQEVPSHCHDEQPQTRRDPTSARLDQGCFPCATVCASGTPPAFLS